MPSKSIPRPTMHSVYIEEERPSYYTGAGWKPWRLSTDWESNGELVELSIANSTHRGELMMPRKQLVQFCKEFLEHNEANP